MDRFVSLDLRPTPEADARIPAFSAAAFYGKGISTTIAIVDGRPFLWDKHRERLIRDADRLGIDPSNLSEDRLLAALSEILRKNERTEGRARITLFENNAGGPWSSGDRSQPTTLITTAGRRPAREMRVSASRYTVNSTSPLTGIKSCNYLEPLMALEEAKSRGFNEGIRLNERGEIASACMANVFWLKDGRLYTPSLRTGCLAGTTREHILENLECEVVEKEIAALREADDIFITSAGIGVVQAADLDGRNLRRSEHPILGVLPY